MPGKARQRGASMVEFTLVAPLAMLLILAIIQVGMVYAAKLTLNHAAFMAALKFGYATSVSAAEYLAGKAR